MFYDAQMNWIRKHVTLRFKMAHTNNVLVETRGYFKLSSASVTKYILNKTYLVSLYPPGQIHEPPILPCRYSNVQRTGSRVDIIYRISGLLTQWS